ncbi:MAG TPA: COP23 domain-containing protein [Waterburya sp.]
MTPQTFTRNARLMSWVFKRAGFFASAAFLLTSSRAFALTQPPVPATSQAQLSHHTLLAEDVVVDTRPQEPKPDPENQASKEPRFTCQLLNGQYTVMYHPESQTGGAYPWATPGVLGGGWTPEKRCNEISRRLELYRPDGLQEMRNAVENNYNIVCVTTQKDPSCRIVLTVPPGQNAEETRNRVFQNLTIADRGEQTNAVNTFAEGERSSQLLNQVVNQGLSALGIGNHSVRHSGNINLRPFLDPADGGTGAMLRRGIQARPNPRLNPDQFR